MKTFLKFKHWQIFLFYVVLSVLSGRDYGLPKYMDELLNVFPVLFIIAWNMLLGVALYSIKPRDLKVNYLPAIWATVLLIILITTTLLTTDGWYDSLFLNIALGVLILVLLFIIAAFPAALLKSIEAGRQVKPMEYGDYIFEFFILFIGVWLYQPRINNVVKTKSELRTVV